MTGNSSGGIRITVREHYRRYDALPPALKAVLQAAPFDFHPNTWERHQKTLGQDVRAIRRAMIRNIADFSAAISEKTYGKDHPCVDRLRAIAVRR